MKPKISREKAKEITISEYKKGTSYRKIEEIIGYSYFWIKKFLIESGLFVPQVTSRIKWDINKARELAKERDPDGKCLSIKYKNMHEPLLWKCGNSNHPEFEAELNSVFRGGSWCPKCWEERKSDTLSKITMDDLHKIAAERGGKCLSSEYRNGKKLEWECSHGHRFFLTYDKVVHRQRWCKICKPWRSEELTRQILQAIFSVDFKKTTLGKLGIEGGGKLELDGYNSDLRIAFEYNGRQHYKKIYTEESFKRTQKNDKEKIKLCKENSINLIIIPFFPRNKKIDHWDYIEKILGTYGFKNLKYIKNYDLQAIFYKTYKEEIEQIIIDHGGKLLSKEILNSTKDVEIECEQGHIFPMTPQKLKQGQWCLHGSTNRALTEKEIIDTVEFYGGTVDSIEKGPSPRIVNCICEEGHHFSRNIHRLRQGWWCNHPDHIHQTKKEKYTKRSDIYSMDINKMKS